MTDQDPIPVPPPPNNYAIKVTWTDGSTTQFTGCSPHTIEDGVARFTGCGPDDPQTKKWELNWSHIRSLSQTPIP